MNALRRVLLTFWGLLCVAVTALFVVMLVNTTLANTVVDFLDKYFLYNMEQVFLHDTGIWMIILIGLAVLALGIFCLIAALKPKHAVKILRVATVDGGSVDISLHALQNVVQKAASGQEGITEVTPKLSVKNNGLHVWLSIVLEADRSAPEMGNTVSEEIKTQLEAMAGIIPAEVKVVITDVVEQKEAATNGKR